MSYLSKKYLAIILIVLGAAISLTGISVAFAYEDGSRGLWIPLSGSAAFLLGLAFVGIGENKLEREKECRI